MKEGRDSWDERVASTLQSLPDLEPPAGFVLRVMEALESEVTPSEATPAEATPSEATAEPLPAGRSPSRRLWQAGAAAFLLSALMLWAAIGHMSTWLELLVGATRSAARVLGFVVDIAVEIGVGFVTMGWTALIKTGIVVSALGHAVATVLQTFSAEYGPMLAAAAGAAVALQLVWLTAMGRRPRLD